MQKAPSIALIDDDHHVRESLRLLLESHGWTAHTYPSGTAFVGHVQRHGGVDCIVLDLLLPDMSGVEVQENLARLGIDIPIVILTATPDHPLAREAVANGAYEVLTKPVRETPLLHTLRAAVAEQSAHD